MKNNSFVHLHTHSEYSLLDGACKISGLCQKVNDLGMNAVAITDHGNLFGAVKFFKAAQKLGLNPIIGCELYVSPTNRFDRTLGEKKGSQHIILLARDFQGYQNLIELVSLGYLEGFYYKPRVDMEILEQYNEGLVCLSACLKGAIAEALLEHNEPLASTYVDGFVNIYGRDNFYLELMDHGLKEERLVNSANIRLAKKHQVGLVATNDCHYLNSKDAEVHEILLCIQTGTTINDPKRLQFRSDQFYLKSPEEMAKLFAEVPQALENTSKIAEMCHVDIPFGQRLIPHFLPPDGKSPYEYLKYLVFQGLRQRYREVNDDIVQRAQMELDVINRMGFDTYFLIVWDFVNFARSHGIPVGPGRGSAAGSLVSYALHITDIEPLSHGLLFERFLNIERISLPDIDIDFCYEKRGQVIDYVRKKYGAHNVAQIITFGTMKAKNAVRDVGRALAIPLGIVDKIAKLIPWGPNLKDAVAMVPELKKYYEEDAQIKKLLEAAVALEGTVRHASTHAAGVVMADRPLTQLVPLYKSPTEQDVATQYDMHDVEDIGLLKMDFLGLRNLTIIEDTLERLKGNRGIEINWDEIPLDDKVTYQMLRQGKTTGVFQLESTGMRELIKRLQPEKFEDLVALLALYRPGPLGSGMVKDFIERKHGRQKIIYDHPLLDKILEATYGIILYQEQVMQIAHAMAGFSLGEADILRRAMGKKKYGEMTAQRSKFIKRAEKKGIDKGVAEKVFDRMAYFAGYGFNKSHSAAYALITFRTGYLKAHFPVEFMASLLTSEMANKEKLAFYINICKEMGIKVLPPDVNESSSGFTVVGDNIVFGLTAVKNVGEAAIHAIIRAREENGSFNSLLDFCLRVDLSAINSRMIEALIKCGAFDSLGFYRPQLLKILPQVIDIALLKKREKASAQASMFDALEDPISAGLDQISLPNVPDWTLREKLQCEKDLVGFYITGHPLDKYRIDVQSFANTSSQAAKNLKENSKVNLVGVVAKVTTKLDKHGHPIAFVQIEDYEGSLELIFFKQAFEKFKHLLHIDEVILVKGVTNRRDKELKIQVTEVQKAEDYRKQKARGLKVEIPLAACNPTNVEEIKATVSRHKGRAKLALVINSPDTGSIELASSKNFSVHLNDELISELNDLNFEKTLSFITSGT